MLVSTAKGLRIEIHHLRVLAATIDDRIALAEIDALIQEFERRARESEGTMFPPASFAAPEALKTLHGNRARLRSPSLGRKFTETEPPSTTVSSHATPNPSIPAPHFTKS